MRNTPIRRESDKHKTKRLAEQAKPLSERKGMKAVAIRRSAIKRKPRPNAETERAHGSEERRAWTKREPCIVPNCGRTPCDAAHLVSGGKGRKADASWTVAFCSSNPVTGYVGHHDEFDNGKQSFMAKYFPGIERAELAVAFEARWQAHIGGGA